MTSLAVAQLAEREDVALEVAGSRPVGQPIVNMRHEPPFPAHRTVMFNGDCDLVVHRASERCSVECPHDMQTCGEFEWP